MTTQEQLTAWATYNAPKELPTIAEQEAWNQIQGILQQHPAEIAASGDFQRLRDLLAFIEDCQLDYQVANHVDELERQGEQAWIDNAPSWDQ
jgi:hypothetical protein